MKSASPLVYLGIGAAIATGALFLMSQSVPPTSPYYSGAYPARKNVVNLFEKFPDSQAIATGQDYVVYTVPSDRWLTVTDCEVYFYNGILQWGENSGGVFTSRGVGGGGAENYGAGNAFQSPMGSQVGWVFAPGSQLVLRNVVGSTSSTPVLYWYYVTGYLSRE